MMTEMRIWDDAYQARITPVIGDLAQPRLGLSDQAYAALCETIDVIYHSGALVNFIYPYEHLKGANVEGTAEILRLAATTRLKAVHHISSIDVLLHTDIPRPFLEDMHLLPVDVPEHGYPRSKWVGDHVARLGRDRAIPVSIYRPGMMIGQTETGATQASDFLLVQIKALLEYGIMPEADFMFDALPIDFVAKAIIHISLRREVLGRNFHLWNLQPIHIADVHGWARSFGYEFDMVGLDETVQALVSLDPEHPMYRMLPLMLSDEVGKIPEAVEPDIARSIDMRAECRNTLAALADSDLYPPPMSEDLAHKVFQFFVDTGFLLDPATQRERFRTLRRAAVGQAS
jgi:thioester reductase-like protein